MSATSAITSPILSVKLPVRARTSVALEAVMDSSDLRLRVEEIQALKVDSSIAHLDLSNNDLSDMDAA